MSSQHYRFEEVCEMADAWEADRREKKKFLELCISYEMEYVDDEDEARSNVFAALKEAEDG